MGDEAAPLVGGSVGFALIALRTFQRRVVI